MVSQAIAEAKATQSTRRIKSLHLIGLSAVIHLSLLLYADHVDSHPERYGGLKYTDVDWRVISDASKLIFSHSERDRAQGWIVRYLQLKIGDPYLRSTFRYTPLLPLLISPTLVHPLLGKSILAITSLLIPPLLLSRAINAPFWPTHLIWTINPFVLNITTRGSPEAFICFLVVALLYSLRRLDLNNKTFKKTNSSRWWLITSAVIFALAVGWKIYPVIYVPAIWAFLAQHHQQQNRARWFAKEIWNFGVVAAGTFGILNLVLWSIWGQPFLNHTYLYHLTRLDHRHNFSPYYYPIYLSLFPSTTTTTTTIYETILRHPLTSFVPQISLVALSGLLLTPVTSLEVAMFVQTVAFVIFNKVCTSQYFTWFLPLLPSIIPHLKLSQTKSLLMVGSWVMAQGIWLAMAFQLELLARNVFIYVWLAGIGLFVVSVWVLGEIVDSFAYEYKQREKQD